MIIALALLLARSEQTENKEMAENGSLIQASLQPLKDQTQPHTAFNFSDTEWLSNHSKDIFWALQV